MAKSSSTDAPPVVPDEGGPRRYLRNTTGDALVVHPSVRPVPDRVEPGELVEVDEWGMDSLKASGFEHVGIATAKPEHEAQVAAAFAAAFAPPEPADDAPVAEQTDDTADTTADDQEG